MGVAFPAGPGGEVGITAWRDGPPAPSITRDDPFVAHVLVVAAVGGPVLMHRATGRPRAARSRLRL